MSMNLEVKEVEELEEVKKETKLNKTKKIMLGGAVALSALLGFKVGMKYSQYLTGKGFEVCFKTDPTLQEHFVSAICESKKKMLMQS